MESAAPDPAQFAGAGTGGFPRDTALGGRVDRRDPLDRERILDTVDGTEIPGPHAGNPRNCSTALIDAVPETSSIATSDRSGDGTCSGGKRGAASDATESPQNKAGTGEYELLAT